MAEEKNEREREREMQAHAAVECFSECERAKQDTARKHALAPAADAPTHPMRVFRAPFSVAAAMR